MTAGAGRRSRSLAEVLTPRLEKKGLVLADEGCHPVEFRPPEAAALVEADGIKPELGQVLVALHVDLRRLGPVAGKEQER